MHVLNHGDGLVGCDVAVDNYWNTFFYGEGAHVGNILSGVLAKYKETGGAAQQNAGGLADTGFDVVDMRDAVLLHEASHELLNLVVAPINGCVDGRKGAWVVYLLCRSAGWLSCKLFGSLAEVIHIALGQVLRREMLIVETAVEIVAADAVVEYRAANQA